MPWQTTWLYQVWEKMLHLQNYTYLRWHQCMCEWWHIVPKGDWHPLWQDHTYKCCWYNTSWKTSPGSFLQQTRGWQWWYKKQNYINKDQDLPSQKDTYRLTTEDPPTKHKNKLIYILLTVRVQGGIGDSTYKRLYPTGAVPNTLWTP